MTPVIVVLADGFEEIEAITPIDLLRRAQLRVVVAGLSALTVTGARGISIQCDCLLADAPAEVAALVLPGGLAGAENLAASEALRLRAQACLANSAYLAAICAAPAVVLGPWGFLDDRTFTCYPGLESRVSQGRFTTDPVVLDGPILTSRGVGTVAAFSLKLIELLAGVGAAETVAQSTLLRA